MVFPLLLLQGPPIQTDGSLLPLAPRLAQDQISGCQSGGSLPLLVNLPRPSAQAGAVPAGAVTAAWKLHRANRLPSNPLLIVKAPGDTEAMCIESPGVLTGVFGPLSG